MNIREKNQYTPLSSQDDQDLEDYKLTMPILGTTKVQSSEEEAFERETRDYPQFPSMYIARNGAETDNRAEGLWKEK
jgi:hypothetical protein